MRPLLFVWPHALVFWAVFFWAFLPEWKIVSAARKAAKNEGSKDAGSIKVIMAAMQLALITAFPLAWVGIGMLPAASRIYVFYLGIVVIFFGSVLRRTCWKTLGEYFTGDVRARADQPVINTGPYRWVRHPSYTAGTLMNVGIGLALTNWFSLLILLITSVGAYMYRVRVEERALVAEIGAPYAEYMRTHKRFIPFVV